MILWYDTFQNKDRNKIYTYFHNNILDDAQEIIEMINEYNIYFDCWIIIISNRIL